ncbi:hypothetical protein FKM82_027652 [Ascaphus truei]
MNGAEPKHFSYICLCEEECHTEEAQTWRQADKECAKNAAKSAGTTGVQAAGIPQTFALLCGVMEEYSHGWCWVGSGRVCGYWVRGQELVLETKRDTVRSDSRLHGEDFTKLHRGVVLLPVMWGNDSLDWDITATPDIQLR